MSIRYLGAIFVITGCGGFGFSMAAAYRREERLLGQLEQVLRFFQCELKYRLTPLPALCAMAGDMGRGGVYRFFADLGRELEQNRSARVCDCIYEAMDRGELTPSLRELLHCLGSTLGRFDLTGQLQELESLRLSCSTRLQALQEGRGDRLRSYQTLGLCAGAALAILFV